MITSEQRSLIRSAYDNWHKMKKTDVNHLNRDDREAGTKPNQEEEINALEKLIGKCVAGVKK